LRIASAKVGKSSDKFAMHCKGVEWGVGGAGNNRDKRETHCYVMSDHGGVHLYGTDIEGQNRFAISDSLTICIRNARSLTLPTLSKALKAATGWDIVASQEELNTTADRILLLERAWNIREGLRPDRDDVMPERVFTEPLTKGPKAGTPAAIYDRRQFEADKQEWYLARGCDTHGIPTKETLRKLGLGFTVSSLEKLVDLE
jgi:aldehyde:ferredoxin oxidoreductase